MTKTVTLTGGPADRAVIEVHENSVFVMVPVVQDASLIMDENDVFPIIGWDDYGPILKRDDILQARYKINGDVAIYEAAT